MQEINLLEATIVFGATLVSDILWALYIRRTGSGQALSAAILSFVIVVLGGVVVVSYVENLWYLIPSALGAFVGTLVTVRYDTARKRRR